MGMLTGKVTNLADFDSGLHSDVDGEREVAKEVDEEEVEMHTQNDEHTSEQHEPANSKIKDKIERDERGREILIIEGKKYTDVWPTYHKVPDAIKRYLFERFKEKFTWHAQWSEQQVYNIFKSYCSQSFSAEMMRLRTVKKSRSASPPDYMRQDIWNALWDIWDTDKFKKLQENNRKNRVSNRDGNGTAI
ncbi:hypothetical protein BUALT_Bualt01G0220800 [Buddleja alternifolia]|uniref:Transposase n=1 Tax=Buddleja alternifolia TaxID=168488 RepID=A0AAV6YJL7_9LAMI|nr:hypothetical protein BUALT_Bualt01G0220800 [Buddleja alternifolia]